MLYGSAYVVSRAKEAASHFLQRNLLSAKKT